MKVWIAAVITVAVIVAVVSYIVNFDGAAKSIAKKKALYNHVKEIEIGISKETLESEDEKVWKAQLESLNSLVGSDMFVMVLKDNGDVVANPQFPRVVGSNFLNDNNDNTTNAFKKFLNRGMTGGGFATFMWVADDVLSEFLAFSHRLENKMTLVLATKS